MVARTIKPCERLLSRVLDQNKCPFVTRFRKMEYIPNKSVFGRKYLETTMPMTYGVQPSPQLNNQCCLPYYAWVGQRAVTSELLLLMAVEQSIPRAKSSRFWAP